MKTTQTILDSRGKDSKNHVLGYLIALYQLPYRNARYFIHNIFQLPLTGYSFSN